jgi:hypothetical protein
MCTHRSRHSRVSRSLVQLYPRHGPRHQRCRIGWVSLCAWRDSRVASSTVHQPRVFRIHPCPPRGHRLGGARRPSRHQLRLRCGVDASPLPFGCLTSRLPSRLSLVHFVNRPSLSEATTVWCRRGDSPPQPMHHTHKHTLHIAQHLLMRICSNVSPGVHEKSMWPRYLPLHAREDTGPPAGRALTWRCSTCAQPRSSGPSRTACRPAR